MNSQRNDAHIIRLALAEAQRALEHDDVPVGAVLAGPDGEVIAACHNERDLRQDPSAHAEMIALRAAAKARGTWRLLDTVLYITLEPCAMCAGAISHARIARLYYGASDAKGGGVEHGARVFDLAHCRLRPEVYSGIGESEAAAVLRAFFAARR